MGDWRTSSESDGVLRIDPRMDARLSGAQGTAVHDGRIASGTPSFDESIASEKCCPLDPDEVAEAYCMGTLDRAAESRLRITTPQQGVRGDRCGYGAICSGHESGGGEAATGTGSGDDG